MAELTEIEQRDWMAFGWVTAVLFGLHIVVLLAHQIINWNTWSSTCYSLILGNPALQPYDVAALAFFWLALFCGVTTTILQIVCYFGYFNTVDDWFGGNVFFKPAKYVSTSTYRSTFFYLSLLFLTVSVTLSGWSEFSGLTMRLGWECGMGLGFNSSVRNINNTFNPAYLSNTGYGDPLLNTGFAFCILTFGLLTFMIYLLMEHMTPTRAAVWALTFLIMGFGFLNKDLLAMANLNTFAVGAQYTNQKTYAAFVGIFALTGLVIVAALDAVALLYAMRYQYVYVGDNDVAEFTCSRAGLVARLC